MELQTNSLFYVYNFYCLKWKIGTFGFYLHYFLFTIRISGTRRKSKSKGTRWNDLLSEFIITLSQIKHSLRYICEHFGDLSSKLITKQYNLALTTHINFLWTCHWILHFKDVARRSRFRLNQNPETAQNSERTEPYSIKYSNKINSENLTNEHGANLEEFYIFY